MLARNNLTSKSDETIEATEHHRCYAIKVCSVSSALGTILASAVIGAFVLTGVIKLPAKEDWGKCEGENCGTTHQDLFDEKIVGGRFAREGEFPFHVAISDWQSIYCGGSMLDDRWILTAAHCLVREDQYRERPFRHPRNTSMTKTLRLPSFGKFRKACPNDLEIAVNITHKDQFNGAKMKVQKIIWHPTYEKRFLEVGPNRIRRGYFDIGLIKTEKSMIKSVQRPNPIGLPAQEVKYREGKPVTVTGFGFIQTKGPNSDMLKTTQINIQEDKSCNWYNYYDSKTMVCAGDLKGQTDSCTHDSGGPLFIKSPQNSYVLLGVVSFGPDEGCAVKGIPSVYMKVSYFKEWISNTMKANKDDDGDDNGCGV